ncbi:MAG: HD domain-containing protein [Oscillospiraceae bacterium]
MWKLENREAFKAVVEDILQDPAVQALGEMEQHSKTCSRLDHSVYVAYLSFLFCRRFGLDHVAAARAGLLHDFFFEGKGDGVRRLWQHPHAALENAEERYDLSDLERDIIVKHMWPLTRPLPRHRESFVVSLADKLCAVMEMSRLHRVFRVQRHLAPAAVAA